MVEGLHILSPIFLSSFHQHRPAVLVESIFQKRLLGNDWAIYGLVEVSNWIEAWIPTRGVIYLFFQTNVIVRFWILRIDILRLKLWLIFQMIIICPSVTMF